ncbi:hypothetical protein BKA82DRAFT_1001801 [Pisolithus tinctorius]|uniref:Uncharacterized protein n=1 Tax=Pisolithus tinctorius Marx 270 TaxID=870435 RepID=A0A0C3NPT9_PISTI|nr:hypothetical protein BKA82DRAFT_1001801 [Pisolithus tinctorius]KIO02860.1 hypothetical protein M404DRAFT_1001801 [Pisolithus tinctorius Marx 270]
MAREILIGVTSNDDSGTQHGDTLQNHISGQNILKRCRAMLFYYVLAPSGCRHGRIRAQVKELRSIYSSGYWGEEKEKR